MRRIAYEGLGTLTYLLIWQPTEAYWTIVCLRCKRWSVNPNDAHYLYCGACDRLHTQVAVLPVVPGEAAL